HYAIDKTWTLDGYGVDWNTSISEGDKETARLAYPHGERTTTQVPQYTVTDYEGIIVEDDPLAEAFKLYPVFTVNTDVRDCKVQVFCFVYDETGKPLPIKDKPGYVVAPNDRYTLSTMYKRYDFNKGEKLAPLYLSYKHLPDATSTKFKVKLIVKMIDDTEVKDIFWTEPTMVNMVRSSKTAAPKTPATKVTKTPAKVTKTPVKTTKPKTKN
ncbi:MAG: hypothetical protein K0Q66_2441, partial [Chitinophagaceae bacterium]|nr:hypothetical protein [Chitinophagaceae bacterium]